MGEFTAPGRVPTADRRHPGATELVNGVRHLKTASHAIAVDTAASTPTPTPAAAPATRFAGRSDDGDAFQLPAPTGFGAHSTEAGTDTPLFEEPQDYAVPLNPAPEGDAERERDDDVHDDEEEEQYSFVPRSVIAAQDSSLLESSLEPAALVAAPSSEAEKEHEAMRDDDAVVEDKAKASEEVDTESEAHEDESQQHADENDYIEPSEASTMWDTEPDKDEVFEQGEPQMVYMLLHAREGAPFVMLSSRPIGEAAATSFYDGESRIGDHKFQGVLVDATPVRVEELRNRGKGERRQSDSQLVASLSPFEALALAVHELIGMAAGRVEVEPSASKSTNRLMRTALARVLGAMSPGRERRNGRRVFHAVEFVMCYVINQRNVEDCSDFWSRKCSLLSTLVSQSLCYAVFNYRDSYSRAITRVRTEFLAEQWMRRIQVISDSHLTDMLRDMRDCDKWQMRAAALLEGIVPLPNNSLASYLQLLQRMRDPRDSRLSDVVARHKRPIAQLPRHEVNACIESRLPQFFDEVWSQLAQRASTTLFGSLWRIRGEFGTRVEYLTDQMLKDVLSTEKTEEEEEDDDDDGDDERREHALPTFLGGDMCDRTRPLSFRVSPGHPVRIFFEGVPKAHVVRPMARDGHVFVHLFNSTVMIARVSKEVQQDERRHTPLGLFRGMYSSEAWQQGQKNLEHAEALMQDFGSLNDSVAPFVGIGKPRKYKLAKSPDGQVRPVRSVRGRAFVGNTRPAVLSLDFGSNGTAGRLVRNGDTIAQGQACNLPTVLPGQQLHAQGKTQSVELFSIDPEVGLDSLRFEGSVALKDQWYTQGDRTSADVRRKFTVLMRRCAEVRRVCLVVHLKHLAGEFCAVQRRLQRHRRFARARALRRRLRQRRCVSEAPAKRSATMDFDSDSDQDTDLSNDAGESTPQARELDLVDDSIFECEVAVPTLNSLLLYGGTTAEFSRHGRRKFSEDSHSSVIKECANFAKNTFLGNFRTVKINFGHWCNMLALKLQHITLLNASLKESKFVFAVPTFLESVLEEVRVRLALFLAHNSRDAALRFDLAPEADCAAADNEDTIADALKRGAELVIVADQGGEQLDLAAVRGSVYQARLFLRGCSNTAGSNAVERNALRDFERVLSECVNECNASMEDLAAFNWLLVRAVLSEQFIELKRVQAGDTDIAGSNGRRAKQRAGAAFDERQFTRQVEIVLDKLPLSETEVRVWQALPETLSNMAPLASTQPLSEWLRLTVTLGSRKRQRFLKLKFRFQPQAFRQRYLAPQVTRAAQILSNFVCRAATRARSNLALSARKCEPVHVVVTGGGSRAERYLEKTQKAVCDALVQQGLAGSADVERLVKFHSSQRNPSLAVARGALRIGRPLDRALRVERTRGVVAVWVEVKRCDAAQVAPRSRSIMPVAVVRVVGASDLLHVDGVFRFPERVHQLLRVSLRDQLRRLAVAAFARDVAPGAAEAEEEWQQRVAAQADRCRRLRHAFRQKQKKREILRTSLDTAEDRQLHGHLFGTVHDEHVEDWMLRALQDDDALALDEHAALGEMDTPLDDDDADVEVPKDVSLVVHLGVMPVLDNEISEIPLGLSVNALRDGAVTETDALELTTRDLSDVLGFRWLGANQMPRLVERQFVSDELVSDEERDAGYVARRDLVPLRVRDARLVRCGDAELAAFALVCCAYGDTMPLRLLLADFRRRWWQRMNDVAQLEAAARQGVIAAHIASTLNLARQEESESEAALGGGGGKSLSQLPQQHDAESVDALTDMTLLDERVQSVRYKRPPRPKLTHQKLLNAAAYELLRMLEMSRNDSFSLYLARELLERVAKMSLAEIRRTSAEAELHCAERETTDGDRKRKKGKRKKATPDGDFGVGMRGAAALLRRRVELAHSQVASQREMSNELAEASRTGLAVMLMQNFLKSRQQLPSQLEERPACPEVLTVDTERAVHLLMHAPDHYFNEYAEDETDSDSDSESEAGQSRTHKRPQARQLTSRDAKRRRKKSTAAGKDR